MATEHPFQMLFETLGRAPVAHAEAVNRRAYEILADLLSVPVEKPGRCILLRAPRAGHGKTHLLSRLQHQLGGSHEMIPLHAALGAQIDAASVTDDVLRCLLRPLPAAGGLCVLDLVTRRLFASALQPLVGSGEVPCQDREGALAALRMRPIETFDFHHPNAVTAHWARENFEVLGQRLSVELAQRCGLPVLGVGFWVDALFRFAATPLENPIRLKVLADAVHEGNPGEGVLMGRLEALLGMLTLLTRVVLVADDLEGFSTDESAALKLAAFLGALRQSVDRLDVILSVNQDIWQSAFIPRLSGGLADRLSEVVVDLRPLTEEEMVALLESRVPGLGARVLSRVDRAAAGSHARGLIRAAGLAWLEASALDARPGALVQPEMPTAEMPAAPPVELPVSPPAAAREDKAPDPTLAIAFLAAAGTASPSPEEWPVPGSTAEESTVEMAPVTAAAGNWNQDDFVPTPESSGFAVETSFQPECVAAELESGPGFQQVTAPQDGVWAAPVESPFRQVVDESAPVFVAETSVPGFDPPPEPAFQVVEQEVPGFSAEPAASCPPAAPDTDRVDDLLRQFRERYGRGSM
jgi:hypothetical protein